MFYFSSEAPHVIQLKRPRASPPLLYWHRTRHYQTSASDSGSPRDTTNRLYHPGPPRISTCLGSITLLLLVADPSASSSSGALNSVFRPPAHRRCVLPEVGCSMSWRGRSLSCSSPGVKSCWCWGLHHSLVAVWCAFLKISKRRSSKGRKETVLSSLQRLQKNLCCCPSYECPDAQIKGLNIFGQRAL